MLESNIWKIAFDLSNGLNSLHKIKYTHRDLKPENILVNSEGNFKICDFSSTTNRCYENVFNHVFFFILFFN